MSKKNQNKEEVGAETEVEAEKFNVLVVANFKDKNTKDNYSKGTKLFIDSENRIAELVKAKVVEEL